MQENNIVKEFYIGETKISISDTYCKNTTPEEVEKILDEIVQKAIGYFQQMAG